MNNGGEKSVFFSVCIINLGKKKKKKSEWRVGNVTASLRGNDCVCLRPAVENLFFFRKWKALCFIFVQVRRAETATSHQNKTKKKRGNSVRGTWWRLHVKSNSNEVKMSTTWWSIRIWFMYYYGASQLMSVKHGIRQLRANNGASYSSSFNINCHHFGKHIT